jgi:hypothetical protein
MSETVGKATLTLISLMAWTSIVCSEPLIGGPYTFNPVDISGGGARPTSADYNLFGSIAHTGTIGISSSASYNLLHGFFSGAKASPPLPPPTPTPTSTDTGTPTSTPTVTRTFTPTITETPTITQTFTPTITDTPTITQTFTPTITDTPTITQTFTPTITDTPTITQTFTPTITDTPTITQTFTPTITETPTITQTFTPTITDTPTITQTFTPTITDTPTITQTFTPTITDTPTITQTFTATITDTPTITQTFTPTITDTPTITQTFTPTMTDTLRPGEPTPTFTPTPHLVSVWPNESFPVAVGSTLFAFTYSEPMNTGAELSVSFGLAPPYTDQVLSASPGWVNPTTWYGAFEITNDIMDGTYTLRIGSTLSQSGFPLPEDTNHRFRVLKQDPGTLTNGMVTEAFADALAMEWEPSPAKGNQGLLGHFVLRAPSAAGPYEFAGFTLPNVTEFVDTGLMEDTRYVYRVYELLFDQSFPELRENRQLTLPFGGRTLAKLANGRAAAISQTQIRISWDGGNDPDTLGFRVFRSVQVGGPEMLIAEVPGTVNSVVDRGLRSDTVYYYDINRFDSGLNSSQLENTLAGKTLNMDSTGDGFVDLRDLFWILGSVGREENTQRVLLDFTLQWHDKIQH